MEKPKDDIQIQLELLKKLREPFPENLINKLPKGTKAQNECPLSEKRRCTICGGFHHPKIIHLDYVGHAALTGRLLDVDPLWDWEPFAIGEDGLPKLDSNGGLWIRLTICGKTRVGYGDAQGKRGGDAIKECIGDALRNAAMRFGAALDLWHKGEWHRDDVAGEGNDKQEDKEKTLKPLSKTEQSEKPNHPSHGKKTISMAQRQRLFAISTTAGWEEIQVKKLIAEYGFKSTREITVDKYNEICETISSSPTKKCPDRDGAIVFADYCSEDCSHKEGCPAWG